MLKSSKIILQKTNNIKPDIAVILGSGLNNFFTKKEIKNSIGYESLPDFVKPTVKGHTGKLVLGSIYNKNVICMYGRAHIYEGHKPQSLVFPIRVLKDIGCKILIITNAAGSLNKKIRSGSLVLISDHINWSGFNPLIGKNNDDYGPRFNDMSDAYNLQLRKLMQLVAKKNKILLHNGVYVMYSGPNFETPAEINALKILGADVVGMSTVPEVLIANHCGMKTLAISVVTNYAAGLAKTKLSHKETLSGAKKAEKNIFKLIKSFIKEI